VFWAFITFADGRTAAGEAVKVYEAGCDDFRLQTGKDPPVHIMFGYAVLQGQELSQLCFLGFSVFLDVFPAFGEGHDGQQGDNDDFYQGVSLVPFDPGVFDVFEEVD
jgi:hypothetical protein